MNKELCRCFNAIEANILKGLLHHQGINVQLMGETLQGAVGELPPDAAQVTVLVDSDDYQQALACYQQFQKQSTSPPWFCSKCQEHNEGSFDFCWRCGEPSADQ